MLIKSIAEIKQYIPINNASYWDSFKPIIEDVEREYIDFIFGPAFKNVVQGIYDASLPPLNIAPTAPYNELIQITQRALVYLAMWKNIPFINVQISDAGIRSSQTSDSEQARMWQIRDLSDMNRERGMFNLNEIYKHLEANVQTYGVWSGNPSPGYTLLKNHLINKTDDVQTHVNINSNRFIFNKMTQLIEAMKRAWGRFN